MRSDLSPVLALAARANAFFRGATGRMEVLAGHPSFARFHDLTFVQQTNVGLNIVAEGSLPWFRRLRNDGVPKVRPLLAGMRADKGTDSAWGLLTDSDRGFELWTPNVGRRFQGHDDTQPLRLTMMSGRFDRWLLKPEMSVAAASEQLQIALEAAKRHLDENGQTTVAAAVGKFLTLHLAEAPEVTGELAGIAPDLERCSLPLFASATRVLALLEATGWLNATDESTRALSEPLWVATRTALETAV